MASPEQSESAKKLRKLVSEVRKVHPRMEVQMLQALVFLYNNPNSSDTDVMAELDLTQGSVSTMMWALASEKKKGEAGYGLIRREEDPHDRRKRSSVLSAKGHRFVERLIDSIS